MKILALGNFFFVCRTFSNLLRSIDPIRFDGIFPRVYMFLYIPGLSYRVITSRYITCFEGIPGYRALMPRASKFHERVNSCFVFHGQVMRSNSDSSTLDVNNVKCAAAAAAQVAPSVLVSSGSHRCALLCLLLLRLFLFFYAASRSK